jgi:hypothetical protein
MSDYCAHDPRDFRIRRKRPTEEGRKRYKGEPGRLEEVSRPFACGLWQIFKSRGVVGGTLVCDRCWYGRGVAEAKKKAPGGTFISVKGSIKLGAL